MKLNRSKSRARRPLEPSKTELDQLIAAYEVRRDDLDLFRRQVADFFQVSKRFNSGQLPLIHSIRSRLKDPLHLRQKILRKWIDGPISPSMLLTRVNDLAGVRVIHLYSQQFKDIHLAINEQIEKKYWHLAEPPIAYSWDPEATAFFTSLGLSAETRESYYTSIHYLVKPQAETDLCCEIQVRTLFEEAWGEIDHALNYPLPSEILACKEQLRVLAKLASTGTRLADSIFATAKQAGKELS